MNHKPQVTMLGTALDTRGGVAVVEAGIVEKGVPGYEIVHVPTHADGAFGTVVPFVKSLRASNFRRSVLAHIHFASRGSFYRKYVLSRVLLRRQIPYVCHAHGAKFDVFLHNSSRVVQNRVRRFLRDSSGIICLSESWQRFYSDIVGNDGPPIWTLPNFAPSARPPPRAESPITILFAGRIGRRKGTFDLIEAYARLERQLGASKVQLVILGDGEIEEARQKVSDLALESCLVPGWVTQAAKQEYLDRSHIFCLPSFHEGLPMSLLEAMANGLAVVTTPVGGIQEIVTDSQNGLLVAPGQVDALHSALSQLVLKHAVRERLSRQGRQTADALGIDNYVSRLAEIYDLVLDGATP